jgi:hypothetical protein
VENGKIVIVYDFVDDFLYFGSDKPFTAEKIKEMRKTTSTTEPVWDPSKCLGMGLERCYKTKTICVRMTDKIDEVYKKFDVNFTRRVDIPMPTSGYIVKEEEFEKLSEVKCKFLDRKGIETYMSIIGCLIWISGVRLDVLFTVMYLSWSTKSPRQHHLDMARYCVAYLYQSRELPLVLGGSSEFEITAYTDASLGTGGKGRSVIGHLVKLNEKSGAIYAKATATQGVHMSSFEAELDGVSTSLKSIRRVNNIMTELQRVFSDVSKLWSDNEAMIKFVHGEGVAKGVRHMELRMWFIREQYSHGNVVLDYMEGVKIPADKLTKLGNRASHAKFRSDILGLSLLPEYCTEFVGDINDFDVFDDEF